MRRAPLFVFGGTVAGLAAILSFHTRPAPSAALPAGGAPRASAAPDHETHKQHRAGSGGRRAAGSGATAMGRRQATGATENYSYGQLAVRVTVRRGRITDVSVPYIQTAEPYSKQLAAQAIPTLRSEVLSGQSANIQGVSGATYTSEAYAQSVQAALDKLHLR
jgi:uncharacterized protein with FMN-binding domain